MTCHDAGSHLKHVRTFSSPEAPGSRKPKGRIVPLEMPSRGLTCISRSGLKPDGSKKARRRSRGSYSGAPGRDLYTAVIDMGWVDAEENFQSQRPSDNRPTATARNMYGMVCGRTSTTDRAWQTAVSDKLHHARSCICRSSSLVLQRKIGQALWPHAMRGASANN